jgi:RNA polymerase sigma-70 factor (ECF subfamily)
MQQTAPRLDPDQREVDQAQAGDMVAFESLISRHRDVVFRVAARVVGLDDAADVSQDAFLRAFHRLTSFHGDAPFRAWLLRIARNAALDHLARRHPERRDEAEFETGPASRLDSVERPPAERLESRERARRLEGKLRSLTPERRLVLVLRDVEGLTYEEIATVVQAPLGTVKARLHRARRDLIDLLRTNTYDWELPR